MAKQPKTITVTKEYLKENPHLKDAGVKVGDSIPNPELDEEDTEDEGSEGEDKVGENKPAPSAPVVVAASTSGEKMVNVACLETHKTQIGNEELDLKKGRDYKMTSSAATILSRAGIVLKK